MESAERIRPARNFQDFLQHAGTNRVLSTLIWTAIFNLPIYKAVAKWSLTDDTPADVRTQIRRFHTPNLGRLTAALATSVLFFVATF
ncbi:hypothetical protein ABIA39_001786 [Nocardia sp. GAS34]|uniref:hypothetical protein n=1 Tax=unclassified Nocardia TaxID=2637762 RepID=UPI003D215449